MDQMITNHQPLTANHRHRVFGVLPAAFFMVLILLLAACGAPEPTGLQSEEAIVGATSPESVAQNFFEDLEAALQDENLDSRDRRIELVEILSSYFAPNERAAQETALGLALYNFSLGQGQLAQDNRRMSIMINHEGVRSVRTDSQRAMVRLENATVTILVTQGAEETIVREEVIPLAELIGNADNAVPTIRIGDRWFLTEGWTTR